jgi:hypothetical protein
MVIPCIKRKEAFTFLHGPLYFDGFVGLTTVRLTVRTNRAARKVSSAGETNEFAGADVVNEPPWERIRLRMRSVFIKPLRNFQGPRCSSVLASRVRSFGNASSLGHYTGALTMRTSLLYINPW